MTGIAAWVHVELPILLSAPQPGDADPLNGKGPEWGKAAPVALLIILLMAIALFFLIKSMGKQLKKVPPSFDTSAGELSGTATLPAGQATAGKATAGKATAGKATKTNLTKKST